MNRLDALASMPTMRRTLITLVVALACSTLSVATAFALRVGARAPELGAEALDGTRITVAGLRGKVVVVDFMASWCEPCADSMPVYQRLYNEYHDRGLVIVGVSQDERADAARRFAQRFSVEFPMIFDRGHRIAGRYSPPRMPTAFVIDREGVIRHIHQGFRNGDARQLEREITELLGRE